MALFISLRRRPRWPALLVLFAVCFALAACGSDGTANDSEAATGASDTPPTASAFPVTVESGPMESGDTITIDAQPHSIVSLSATATEVIWAIGAGDQVVAVDAQSDYPEGVPTTDLSGYEPNVEAILGYEPDLVVTSRDSGDLVASLAKVEVPVLVLPAATSLAESYAQIERLGGATGHADEAAAVAADMKAGVEQAVADAPDGQGLTYFHELGPELYTVTGDTFIGEIYGLFGMSSIGDAAGDGDVYPQLSSEYVVSADPDLILLADQECCGVSEEDVRARPGWERMSAVRADRVYVVNEDIVSRWGPRVVEFVEQIGQILAEQSPSVPPSS